MSKPSAPDALDQRNLPALPDELLAVLSLENPLHATSSQSQTRGSIIQFNAASQPNSLARRLHADGDGLRRAPRDKAIPSLAKPAPLRGAYDDTSDPTLSPTSLASWNSKTSSSKEKRIRKAASAESLRSASRNAMQADLDIIHVPAGRPSAFPASRSDIKYIWKSLSARLHTAAAPASIAGNTARRRPGERQVKTTTELSEPPASRPSLAQSVREKSSDGSRTSFSLPHTARKFIDEDGAVPQNTVILKTKKTMRRLSISSASTSQSARQEVLQTPSLPSGSTEGQFPKARFPNEAAFVPSTTIHIPHDTAELAPMPVAARRRELETSAPWNAGENFVHDLSRMRRRQRSAKPSLANLSTSRSGSRTPTVALYTAMSTNNDNTDFVTQPRLIEGVVEESDDAYSDTDVSSIASASVSDLSLTSARLLYATGYDGLLNIGDEADGDGPRCPTTSAHMLTPDRAPSARITVSRPSSAHIRNTRSSTSGMAASMMSNRSDRPIHFPETIVTSSTAALVKDEFGTTGTCAKKTPPNTAVSPILADHGIDCSPAARNADEGASTMPTTPRTAMPLASRNDAVDGQSDHAAPHLLSPLVHTRLRSYSDSHAFNTVKHRPRPINTSLFPDTPDASSTTRVWKGPMTAVMSTHMPRPRSDSSSNLLKQLTSPRTSTADFVIAIVGPKRVGKTTIIESNLKQSSKRSRVLYEDDRGNRVVSYEGVFAVLGMSRTIETLEVDMDILRFDTEGLVWPPYLPKPDGAMICFKHGAAGALDDLRSMLRGFWTRGGIAIIALATQCKPAGPVSPKPEGDKAAEMCNIHGAGLVHLDGGADDPGRKAKNSLQWILRKIINSRAGHSAYGPQSPSNHQRTRTVRDIATHSLHSTHDKPGEDAAEVAKRAIISSNSSTHDAELARSLMQYSLSDVYLAIPVIIQKALYTAVTSNDDGFVQHFLIIYRRFTTPHDVLTALGARVMSIAARQRKAPLLIAYTVSKLLHFLSSWTDSYPHDFTSACSRALLGRTLTQLYELPHIRNTIQGIPWQRRFGRIDCTTETDTAWGLPDNGDAAADALTEQSTAVEERRPSLAPSLVPSLISDTSTLTDISGHLTPLVSRRGGTNEERKARFATLLTSPNGFYPDDRRPLARSAAHKLSPGQRHIILVDSASRLMLQEPSATAEYITYRAKQLFSRIGPRDILRYVLAPRDPDDPAAAPIRDADGPVSKVISLGNYLSDWVATVILVQPKPRLRIKAYELLVRIAMKLREADNFDCLMAILLGLNSQPVHRLVAHDTLDQQLGKRLESLNRLMSATRSFAAYRLAIGNARPDMIPYLGVHLQDVTRLHEGKPDMCDGAVNWTKMRQVAKHCEVTIGCTKYSDVERPAVTACSDILDLPVYNLDDDALYDLSYMYKPRRARPRRGSTQASKIKKFLAETILN